MSESLPSVPLTVVSTTPNNFFYAQIVIGKNSLNQQLQSGGGYYWFVVINRSTLAVEYNQLQTDNTVAPNIGGLNTSDHILIVATLGVGLNVTPQGDLFNFLDLNGGAEQLRRVEQVGLQLNCGSWGTFGYALVGVLGSENSNGLEASTIGNGALGPILTVQLMPSTINGQVIYTPIQLSNA